MEDGILVPGLSEPPGFFGCAGQVVSDPGGLGY